MKGLLIVIPAYNEGNNIGSVIEGLQSLKNGYPLLVIDDGSADDTSAVSRGKGVKVLRHRVNLGLSEAIRTGMKYALAHDYSYVMQFDADGQHDAEYIDLMYEKAKTEKWNIVIGSRYSNNKAGVSFRRLGSTLLSLCIRIMSGARIKDPTSGMRIYDSTVMKLFTDCSNYSPEPDTLSFLIDRGLTVSEVPVRMNERISGKSYLDITESVRYMFRMCSSILLLQWIRR